MNQGIEKAGGNGILKGILIGFGIGGAAGGFGGYFFAKRKMKKSLSRAYQQGYNRGEHDAEKEAQEIIDEIRRDTIVIDDDAKPEDIQKAIQEAKERKEVQVSQMPPNEEAAEKLNRAYEEAIIQNAGDPDEWDLSIDGEEAAKRSEERSRYLDLIDKYKHNPEDGPMHISRKSFEEECYLEKDWVTYYAGDNVFASDQDADSPMDGFANFGVTDGNELFKTRVIDDEENDDPNITYIRNFGLNTVYEITRTKGSYAELKSGEAFLNGESGETAGGS